MSEPGDDHLSRAQNELGEPEALFQISRSRFYTKLWAGVGLVAGSLAAVLIMFAAGLGFDIAILAKILLTPMAIGVAILATMYRQRGLMVLVYPTGVLRLRRGAVDSFPWDEIAEIRLKVQRLDAPEITYDGDGDPTCCWLPTEVPSIQMWKAGLTVERADGTEAHISPALADYDRLSELVQRRTFTRAWALARDRLLTREEVEFGDLIVTPAGLRYSGKRLSWRDFKEMTIAQGRLSIKKTSGWLPWAVVDAGKIPNPHVLFALVGEARRFFKAAAKSLPKVEGQE